MAPLQFEALLLGKVWHSLVAVLRILVTEEEGTRVFVSLSVVAGCRESPRSLGINLTQQLQVPFIVHGEIISAISEIESSCRFIAVGWHDETAAVALGEREEAVRDGKRHRHITHHEIGWSEYHILARPYLGSGERDVEVGMRIIAGGIPSVLQIDDSR